MKVTCIKDVFLSLPDKVAIDNGLPIDDDEMYHAFKVGDQYTLHKEYLTLGLEIMREVNTHLVYRGHPSRTYVYDLFVTRNNPYEVRDRVVNTKDFDEYFVLPEN